MSDAPALHAESRQRMFANLGAGRKGSVWLPPYFTTWRELRIDLDPTMAPDILADITNLSAIESGSVDAVYAAHCLEHLYLHQVDAAVAEAFRILADDGFFCLIVPDLQAIGEYIVNDRMHDVIYESDAGPVTAHDMLYGFGPYLAKGMHSMAHRCAFSPGLLLQKLQTMPFAEIVMRRRPNQELAAIASKRAAANDEARDAFIAALQL